MHLVDCARMAYPAVCRCSDDLTVRGRLSHEMVVSAHCGVATTVISIALAVLAIFACVYASCSLAAGLAGGSLLLFVLGHDWCYTAKNLKSILGSPEQPADLSAILRIASLAQLQEKTNEIFGRLQQNTWIPLPFVDLRSIPQCICLESQIEVPERYRSS